AVVAAGVPRTVAAATPPHPAEPAEHPEQQEEHPDAAKSAVPPANGLGRERAGLMVRADAVGDGGDGHERQRCDCPGDPRCAAFHSISIVHGSVLSPSAISITRV